MQTRNGQKLGVWITIDQETYDEALEVLPPAKMWRDGFLLGVKISTTKETGESVWQAFVQKGQSYYKALVTRNGLNAAMESI